MADTARVSQFGIEVLVSPDYGVARVSQFGIEIIIGAPAIPPGGAAAAAAAGVGIRTTPIVAKAAAPGRTGTPAGRAGRAGIPTAGRGAVAPPPMGRPRISISGSGGAMGAGVSSSGRPSGTRGGYTVRGKASMKLYAVFRNRSYANALTSGLYNLVVDEYTWSVIGGPKTARLSVTGSQAALWQLPDLLRYAVDIYDNNGRWLWWGYIWGIDIQFGNLKFGVDLSQMWNSIKIAYTKTTAGSPGPGERGTTAAATDDDSINVFGTREWKKSLNDITDAAGLQKAAELLARFKYPMPTWDTMGGTPRYSATLYCRGWWDTLDWKYYNNAGTTNVATTTQIGTMITSAGQFLAGSTIVNASGISTNEYRDGDTRGRTEVEQLLEIGTTTPRRLLATVDRFRQVWIYEEPARGSEYLLDRDISIHDQYGVEIAPQTCPVGKWVKLRNVIPTASAGTRLSQPDVFFIEEAAFSARDNRLYLTPRGNPTPDDLVNLGE